MRLDNDGVLLKGAVEQFRDEIDTELELGAFFELWVAQQLLMTRGLSWAEIEEGNTGGGGDGGIDGFYAFQGGLLLGADATPIPKNTEANFDVTIVQSKLSPRVGETIVHKLSDSLKLLLDLTRDIDDDTSDLSPDLISLATTFRSSFTRAAGRFPAINLRIVVASLAPKVSDGVSRRAARLKTMLQGMFSDCEVEISFLGPRDLLDLARRHQPENLELRVEEWMTASGEAYACLVRLADFHSFIVDDNGELRSGLFESNVRAYEGSSTINAAIRATLSTPSSSTDFWWLNNGITVIAKRAMQTGKTLTLSQPQIVNGLQTTTEVHSFFAEHPEVADDDRALLVRVVVPPTDRVRDQIIRATNSQSALPGVALRATDRIQIDIEDFFGQHGMFYERRKGKYAGQGRPPSKIVTVPYLAEAVLAAILNEPHVGTPRVGGRFLRDDTLYERIFDPSIPLSSFLRAALLVKRVEERARAVVAQPKTEQRKSGWPRRPRLRLVLCVSMCCALANANHDEPLLADFEPASLSIDEIDHWAEVVGKVESELGGPGRVNKSHLADEFRRTLRDIATSDT